jgi:hypothetical protein
MTLKELANELNKLKMRFSIDTHYLRIISERQGVVLYIRDDILHGYRLGESPYPTHCPIRLPVPIIEEHWEWLELSIDWLSSKGGEKYTLSPVGLIPRQEKYRIGEYPYYMMGSWYPQSYE